MEFILALLAALVPALVLLFAPREWFKPLAAVALGLFLLGVIWTVSFSNTCQSDGCIGIFLIGAITATLGLSSALAGSVRWALIASRSRQDHPED
ncbi:hypothetical protein ACLBKU_06755 [Erythrobacter sp. NE805]|uniref:hypothetical protein n=1 Tax=Erythrobacter sp. NE805 TaxID=3389875 RepID=UPI00396B3AAF